MRLPTSREDGVIERRTHDYDRHGTTTLFAGLIAAVTAETKVKAGTVIGTCMPRHRAQEFRKFLDEVENVMSRTASTCTRAPQTLTPLRAIASKTGWTSVGELPITRRISLLAVSRSNAALTCAFASVNA